MISVFLNHQTLQVPAQTTLAALLAEHAPQDTPFAVAVNCEFIPKSRYAQQALQANDQIELLSPVGGG